MVINFGGFQSHSLVDWPGKSACVVFLRGCPLRCPRCINGGLQGGKDPVSLDSILDLIDGVKNVSAVMISGGECLMQPGAVAAVAGYAHDIGLLAGIETSGVLPENLKNILPQIDYVLMSIKEELKISSYLKATGTATNFTGFSNLSDRVAQSLDIINDWNGEVMFATPVGELTRTRDMKKVFFWKWKDGFAGAGRGEGYYKSVPVWEWTPSNKPFSNEEEKRVEIFEDLRAFSGLWHRWWI